MQFECKELFVDGPRGVITYEEEYGRWLAFFEMLATSFEKIECFEPPPCWVPLIRYLGHDVVEDERRMRWDCDIIDWWGLWTHCEDKRYAVDVACASRPELVDALYRVDNEWPCPMMAMDLKDKFYITTGSAFFRPELTRFIEQVQGFDPDKERAVLVPCSADKPYPAPLHLAVENILAVRSDEWHQIAVAGALGIAPEELWSSMPHYDSGIPNFDRAVEMVAWYFTKHRYKTVVVYSDFYADAICSGFEQVPRELRPSVYYMFGTHYRDHYDNLLLPVHLRRLERTVIRMEQSK